MSDRYKNYVSVAERVAAATGQMQTVVAEPPVLLTDTMGYIRVTVALADGRSATGTASFRLDLQGKSAQATNPIEDCETSAIGRALGLLGYYSDRSIASAEEVAEAQRRAEASYQPPAPKQNGNGNATDAKAKFYAQWGAVAGTHWGAVQGFLGTKDREPTTVEGWRDAWLQVRDKAKELEYDAVEEALTDVQNGTAELVPHEDVKRRAQERRQ